MRDILAELGYAARTLSKKPSLAAVAVLLLALAIRGNTMVFSLVDCILLRPLPFRDPQRLVAIWETTHEWDPKVFSSYRDVEAFRRQSRSFAALAGWQWVEYTLTGRAIPAASRARRSRLLSLRCSVWRLPLVTPSGRRTLAGDP
jgi:hypothetical protein